MCKLKTFTNQQEDDEDEDKEVAEVKVDDSDTDSMINQSEMNIFCSKRNVGNKC